MVISPWKLFLKQHPVKKYAKGQMIICQDTSPQYCFVLRKGFVKTYVITAEGNEKPISFEGKNDIFPVDVVFGHSDGAKYFYDAYTDCEISQVPAAEFVQYIKEHPRVLHRMFNYLIRRTLTYHDHIASLEQAKAVDKLLYALRLLTSRFGKQITRTRAQMTLPLTQQDLANFLGLTRETTGAQLKTLERDGIIRYHRQQYLIDTERLAMLIEQR